MRKGRQQGKVGVSDYPERVIQQLETTIRRLRSLS